MSYQDDVGSESVIGPAPTMNQYQLHSLRVMAEQRITEALQDFAKQLPDGLLYLQGALDGMGAVLDELQMRAHQFLDTTQVDVNTPRYDQFKDVEAATRGAEESAEIKDYNSAGGA